MDEMNPISLVSLPDSKRSLEAGEEELITNSNNTVTNCLLEVLTRTQIFLQPGGMMEEFVNSSRRKAEQDPGRILLLLHPPEAETRLPTAIALKLGSLSKTNGNGLPAQPR